MHFKIFLITCISSHSQPASQPAVRPGCARCRALKITQTTGYCVGFTKLLFRRLFSYCAMVILLSFLTLLSSLSIGMLECVNNFSVTTTFHTRCKQVQSYAPAVLCYKSLRRLLYMSSMLSEGEHYFTA